MGRLLDCSFLERILSNLVLSGSTSIALYETFLLLLWEKKRKLAEKEPQMCYNHYTSRWLHLFNMLFLTFFCLLFLSHESCACGVSERKAKQPFSKSHFFPQHGTHSNSYFNLPILNNPDLKSELPTLPYDSLLHSPIH